MSRPGRSWRLPLLLLLGGLALFLLQRQRTAISLAEAAGAPPAPRLSVRDAQGNVRRLADRRGTVVLVNLWADWCGPCRLEVPRMTRLDETFAPEGLEIWAVNADGLAGERLLEAAGSIGIGYSVYEPLEGLEGFPGGTVLPFTWLIDREGRLRAAHGGLPSEGSLRRAARRLLDER